MSMPCNICKGSGNVREPYNIHSTPCCACNGTGHESESYKCPECEAYHLGGASSEVVRQRKIKEAAPLMLEALKKIVAETECQTPAPLNSRRRVAAIAQAAIDAAEGKGDV